MDRGAWKAAVHGIAEGRTRPSNFTFIFHFHVLEKEMATHSNVLAWRIPGTGEPGGLPSMGLHRVGHDWSDLAVATQKKQIRYGIRLLPNYSNTVILWVAIAVISVSLISFITMWVHAKSLPLCPTLGDPKDCRPQTPLSMEFFWQEYWSGLPCPPPGNLPNRRIKPGSPMSPALQQDSLLLSHQGSPWSLCRVFSYLCAY